jgi:hypothetical protein
MENWPQASLKDVDFDGIRKEAARLRAEAINAFWAGAARVVLAVAGGCHVNTSSVLAASRRLQPHGHSQASPTCDA